MRRWLLFLALAVPKPLIAQPAAKTYSCEAPAAIQTDINVAGSRGIEALLEKNPGDFWVRLVHINSATGVQGMRDNGGMPGAQVRDSVVERYRKEFENRPEDPEAAYLYAYSMIHSNTAKSVEMLTGLTKSSPSFPRLWLTLAAIHTYPDFMDAAKVQQYTEKFLTLCPDSLEPRAANLASRLDRTETAIAYAKALRERISGKENEQMLMLYESLWQLESKLAQPSEQAEYRKRLEGDLKFLEGLDKTKFRLAETLLTQGAQRLGTGTDSASFIKAQMEWQQKNPRPSPGASPEERAAYSKMQFQFLDQWLEKLPNDLNVVSNRFAALSAMQGVSDETLIREGNEALSVLRRSATVSPNTLDVLRAWAQRGLELNRIPALVQEVVEQQQRNSALPSGMRQSDLYGESYLKPMMENSRWTTDVKAWGVLTTSYVKSRRLDKAREALGEWGKGLAQRRKKAKEINERQASQPRGSTASSQTMLRSIETSIVSGLPNDEANYYECCAQLAAAEDRALDALAFYQSSWRLMYGRTVASSDLRRMDNVREAEGLWGKLGGSQAAWDVWLDSITAIAAPKVASAPRWSGANRAIPRFSLPDQNGKTWTLDSLKGKTTLVNVWATWCAPCRLELPYVQELYEKSKGRGDIQVIALNIDSDQSLVEPFLKKNNYSFPSLFAKPFMESFAGSIGIPMTWIVDSTGTIRNETLGYSSSNTEWVSQMLKKMESIVGAKPR